MNISLIVNVIFAAYQLNNITDDATSHKLPSLKRIDLPKSQLTSIPIFKFLLQAAQI